MPVAVGTAAVGMRHPARAVAAGVVALALQVGVNYANDYFDARSGVDTPSRAGPVRATASGLVKPKAMLRAALLSLSVAAITGFWLASQAGWELLLLGAAAMAAAMGYSGGPKPYASAGLGEVSVFTFFGLAATIGSAYVQTERFSGVAAAAAIPVGLLAVALLVVNNLRDLPTDRTAGKFTLAVRIGEDRTKSMYVALICLSCFSLFFVAHLMDSVWPLLGLLSAPLAIPGIKAVVGQRDTSKLVRALHSTSRMELAFGVLTAVGFWLARVTT